MPRHTPARTFLNRGDNMTDSTPILISRRRVSQICGMERSAIYERIARGDFPKPVTIGTAAVRWIEAEVVAWVQQQIDASRAPQTAKGVRRGRA
ncbi:MULTISPECIES: helix-turn-helix transcriptional regulator [Paraburkholderia]|uniref:helix-turn-helix transcriptional regulator n=1 Tax=Paraburkholderia TaxID=1822464 RepID=UPI001EF85A28|nr:MULTISPECIES: AlpA family phage regulatory protein [Paraburkholderia]MDH6150606.1 prophage regulatory protein [Paraburkholderia sp. WSM4179]